MHAATETAFAAALLDPAKPVPAGIISARGEHDAARFAVYRNNVFVGLTRALANRFPVTERLVGTEFFAGMARVFAGRVQPASPLIFDYGDGFPAFVEAFAPARSLPWLADVARIEAAFTRAYHAADLEPLSLDRIAAIDPELLTSARLVAHPSATLTSSRYPAGSIWAAHQKETVEPLLARGAETVLVIRPRLDVSVHVLPAQDSAFAAALFQGDEIGSAAERALAADASFDFGTALVGLISLGAFGGIATELGTRDGN
jgi:hypothetical protein